MAALKSNKTKGTKPTNKKLVAKKRPAKKPITKKRLVTSPKKPKAQVKKQDSEQPISPKTGKSKGTVHHIYQEALTLLYEKNYKKANQRLSNIANKFPQELEVIARVKSLLKVCEKNMRVEKKQPQTAEEVFHQGVLCHNAGKFDEALDCFSRALKLTKKEKDHIHYAQAATEASMGNHENALTHLREAIQIRQENRFFANNDPDFEPLHENEQFAELLHPESAN